MKIAKFLLPLLPLAELSLASRQQHQQGKQNCSSTGIVPADLLAGLTGLVFVSRTLWLETLHANSHTAAKTGDDIIGDILIGSDAIIMHTLSLQDTAPYDRTLEESVLFTGFLAWEKQTSGFLTTLGQSAETFRKAAPHLGPDLASNLTVFKNNAAGFCAQFHAVVPSLALNVSEVVPGLIDSFEDTIRSLRRKGPL